MRAIQRNSESLWLLFDLNWDRLMYLGAIGAALMAGVWVGSL